MYDAQPQTSKEPYSVRIMIARIIVLSLAFLITDAVMDSVTVSRGFFGLIGLSIVYGLVSGIIGTLLRLFTFPLVLLTLGLFEFVINAVLLLLTDWLTGDWLVIDDFFSALGAAVILTLASAGIGLLVSFVTPSTRG